MVQNIALNVAANYIMTNYLISIVGPTAIGKTNLSIALAQHFHTEIISADSRQFFKEMQIGTAAPNQEELQAAPHHFIHHKSIFEDYNVGAFEKDALNTLENLFKKNRLAIMVGGSGLYVDAVTKGLDDFPEIDPSVRNNLNIILDKDGLEPLKKQLKELDINTYKTIALENPHRVMRALEVCIGSGKPYSSFINKKKDSRNFKTLSIGLTAEREVIYQRINERVDLMVDMGLLEEAKRLYPNKELNSLNTVGYKELFKYFEGEWTLDFAISEIKKNSRRFAKRQLTWFKKTDDISWFDYKTHVAEIINAITEKIERDEAS
ncbi:tRNA (adenosine(37)-N6)-dimethylallyltransferase MiaA [Hanstruepera ponticola]|uniref:tRNA (adenosine(37)-N6)-dimethylallyltransferase MiaA n=1 Tax=Hanstruepera ponticola TaxID=2042995 RepID=UPI001EEEC69F|nr:tRNA (adenosine(37)-N6)-dimethylallyltransferase MiaA [Hanstruepera ponticola]